MGRTPETGLTLAEWHEFPRYALACILMHAVKTAPARFWRVFGVLPVSRQKRPEAVLAVLTIKGLW